MKYGIDIPCCLIAMYLPEGLRPFSDDTCLLNTLASFVLLFVGVGVSTKWTLIEIIKIELVENIKS